MVDTLLLHHYQRLWKVEATPEIIQTRPRSSSKTRAIGRSPGLLRKHFSSASNLCHSPYLPINNGLDFSTEVNVTLTSMKFSNVPTASTRVSMEISFYRTIHRNKLLKILFEGYIFRILKVMILIRYPCPEKFESIQRNIARCFATHEDYRCK